MTITEQSDIQIEIPRKVANKEKMLIVAMTRTRQYHNLKNYNLKFDYKKQQDCPKNNYSKEVGCQTWSVFCYLRCLSRSQISRTKREYIIQEYRSWSKTTFGFSIYTIPLQGTLVIYFGLELRILESEWQLEGSKMCYCKH